MPSRSTASTRELLELALHLDGSEQASLAGALIESLHEPGDAGADETWERVIERRVRELEADTAEAVSWSAVRGRLFTGPNDAG